MLKLQFSMVGWVEFENFKLRITLLPLNIYITTSKGLLDFKDYVQKNPPLRTIFHSVFVRF